MISISYGGLPIFLKAFHEIKNEEATIITGNGLLLE